MSEELNAKGNISPSAAARPPLLTCAVVIGLIGALMALPLGGAWRIGTVYAFQLLLSSVVGAVCMYGYWRLWRWAVFTYSGFCILYQLLLLLWHHSNLPTLAIQAFVVVVGLIYLGRMR
jgi:hypothetical protein